MELLLSGRFLSAREAVEWGLVSRWSSPTASCSMPGSTSPARSPSKSPLAVANAKQVTHQLWADNGSVDAGLQLRARARRVLLPDLARRAEGLAAFAEKRAPLRRALTLTPTGDGEARRVDPDRARRTRTGARRGERSVLGRPGRRSHRDPGLRRVRPAPVPAHAGLPVLRRDGRRRRRGGRHRHGVLVRASPAGADAGLRRRSCPTPSPRSTSTAVVGCSAACIPAEACRIGLRVVPAFVDHPGERSVLDGGTAWTELCFRPAP